jgi:hypothetical protein
MVNSKTAFATAVSIVLVAACTQSPAPQSSAPEAAATAQAITQRYVSEKTVTTDCRTDFIRPMGIGFAERPGAEIPDMPPMVAQFMSKGADRPPVETDKDRVAPGVVFIEPGFRFEKYLVDTDGEVIGAYKDDFLGFTKLLPDGGRIINKNVYTDVFKTGGGFRGCLEEVGPDGSLKWRLGLSFEDYIQHHDMVKLPNGNILTITWENVLANQAIELGRNPEDVAENGNFWFDGIIEVNPMTAEIVWEWSARDHLIQDFDPGKPNYGVVADHPERLDINAFRRNNDGSVSDDWTHVNALDYNAELEQIVFSSPNLSEIFIIDHSTTPFEAAGSSGGRYGKGGDFLYRWGNPANYDRGDAETRTLHAQHNSHWIPDGLPGAGNIMVFNNGSFPDRPYSTVVEIVPPMNDDGSYVLGEDGSYDATEIAWEYNPEGDEQFFSFFISGAQRLPNGNTLVNQGAGARVREVTPEGDIVFEYRHPEADGAPHMLFRAYKFPVDHPAIQAILGQAN